MALEMAGCKIIFSYWLAKISVSEKSAKMLPCSPFSFSKRALNKISEVPAFYKIVIVFLISTFYL
jgi:hypothetical protein